MRNIFIFLRIYWLLRFYS